MNRKGLENRRKHNIKKDLEYKNIKKIYIYIYVKVKISYLFKFIIDI